MIAAVAIIGIATLGVGLAGAPAATPLLELGTTFMPAHLVAEVF